VNFYSARCKSRPDPTRCRHLRLPKPWLSLFSLGPRMAPSNRSAYSRSFVIASASLAALYAVARVFQILPGKLPMVAVVALHVLPLLIFALIHGAVFYHLHAF